MALRDPSPSSWGPNPTTFTDNTWMTTTTATTTLISSNRSSPPVRSNYLTSVSSSCPSKQELCCRLTRPVPHTVCLYLHVDNSTPTHINLWFFLIYFKYSCFLFSFFPENGILVHPPPSHRYFYLWRIWCY